MELFLLVGFWTFSVVMAILFCIISNESRRKRDWVIAFVPLLNLIWVDYHLKNGWKAQAELNKIKKEKNQWEKLFLGEIKLEQITKFPEEKGEENTLFLLEEIRTWKEKFWDPEKEFKDFYLVSPITTRFTVGRTHLDETIRLRMPFASLEKTSGEPGEMTRWLVNTPEVQGFFREKEMEQLLNTQVKEKMLFLKSCALETPVSKVLIDYQHSFIRVLELMKKDIEKEKEISYYNRGKIIDLLMEFLVEVEKAEQEVQTSPMFCHMREKQMIL